MLIRTEELWGVPLETANGPLGCVHDLQVDDRSWLTRDIVVKTRHWLTGRLILLDPRVVSQSDRGILRVALTPEQLARAPGTETHLPVARQQSVQSMNSPALLASRGGLDSCAPSRDRSRDGDHHLRSLRELSHYRIEAGFRDAGQIMDWLVDDRMWRTCYAVVRTPLDSYPGKYVLVPVSALARITWATRVIHVDREAHIIVHAPSYEPAPRPHFREPLTMVVAIPRTLRSHAAAPGRVRTRAAVRRAARRGPRRRARRPRRTTATVPAGPSPKARRRPARRSRSGS